MQYLVEAKTPPDNKDAVRAPLVLPPSARADVLALVCLQTGWTPLMYACMMGNLDVVNVLHAAGADIQAGNDVSARASDRRTRCLAL